MSEARAKSPASNWRMRSGRTGAMMPKASMSEPTIMRMKTRAARLGFAVGVGKGEEDKFAPVKREIVARNERARQRIRWVREIFLARIQVRLSYGQRIRGKARRRLLHRRDAGVAGFYCVWVFEWNLGGGYSTVVFRSNSRTSIWRDHILSGESARN